MEATRTIARAARVVGAHLVHISTNYVFDGEKGLYREDDTPNPVNYYGLTKLVAEEMVRSTDTPTQWSGQAQSTAWGQRKASQNT